MTEEIPKKKRRTFRRSKGKGTANHYFTKVHEQAIIDYVASTDQRERERLYRDFIQPAFNELVDKIVFTYKFTSLPNCDDLRQECKVWLTTILAKFDPSKGSKAFSYFSVITKNWFIHKVKKNQYARQREIHFDDIPKLVEQKHLSTVNAYLPAREKAEFWASLECEMNQWSKMPMKTNEEKVYKACRILLQNPDEIEIFNKKAIYLYIREMTGLNTKQVVNNLNKLRAKYKLFKEDWDTGKVNYDLSGMVGEKDEEE